MYVSSSEGALQPPFNTVKLTELANTALEGAGFTPPNCVLYEIGSENQVIDVEVAEGFYSPAQITQLIALLDSVATDPTRNELTEDQQDNEDINNKFIKSKANRDAIRGPRTNNTQTAPGLKDQMNGNSTFNITGLKPQLLTNSAWNALTNGAKLDLLRDHLKGNGFVGLDDIVLEILNILLDGAQADTTELRLIRDRLLDNQN